MNFNHILKKVGRGIIFGRGRRHDLFSFNVFLNLYFLNLPFLSETYRFKIVDLRYNKEGRIEKAE
jgi:hypothetical protein